jgi:hypothetical protein
VGLGREMAEDGRLEIGSIVFIVTEFSSFGSSFSE